ncbi:hypothetical protein [Romboutsia sp. 1001285H_161024_C4]|uniref:hypothetical protein n=1 Tax=Romboutsia sp. 1001285H_161024_C4 TaxID=2787109 RepID=UPI00189B85D2|nr:hypothetical protein [Romboutsia sp. 1001285H_161024_C4]
MAKKKYIKDENGKVRALSTSELGLEKPLGNENYDVNVFNRNMDKVDSAIKKVKSDLSNIDLTAERVEYSKNECTNVDEALDKLFQADSEHKTSILSLEEDAGDLTTLQTTNKTNLVNAINEVFQNANNGKDIIANAIGSPLVNSDTFSTMGTKIDTLTQTFQNTLKEKGVEVMPSDKTSSLISKVDSLPSVINNKRMKLFATDIRKHGIHELNSNLGITRTNVLSHDFDGIEAINDKGVLRLYACDYAKAGTKVHEISPSTLTIIKSVDIGNTLYGVGGDFDGTNARLFLSSNDKKVHELDIDTLAIKQTSNVNYTYNLGVGGFYDGNKLRLFTNGRYELNELDPNTLAIIKTKTYTSSESGYMYGLGGAYDGKVGRLFAANSEYFFELDTTNFNIIRSVKVPDIYNMMISGIGGSFENYITLQYEGKIYK